MSFLLILSLLGIFILHFFKTPPSCLCLGIQKGSSLRMFSSGRRWKKWGKTTFLLFLLVNLFLWFCQFLLGKSSSRASWSPQKPKSTESVLTLMWKADRGRLSHHAGQTEPLLWEPGDQARWISTRSSTCCRYELYFFLSHSQSKYMFCDICPLYNRPPTRDPLALRGPTGSPPTASTRWARETLGSPASGHLSSSRSSSLTSASPALATLSLTLHK